MANEILREDGKRGSGGGGRIKKGLAQAQQLTRCSRRRRSRRRRRRRRRRRGCRQQGREDACHLQLSNQLCNSAIPLKLAV